MVVILGNGFDLNLGLKTGYQDFIKSKYFADLVENGSALAIHLKEKNDLQKWIDIENELKDYSQNICIDNNRSVFRAEYKTLCQSLCSYLNNLDYSTIDVNSIAYKKIKEVCDNNYNITICNFNYTKSIDFILTKKDMEKHDINIIQLHGRADCGNIIFGVEDGALIDNRDIFLLKSANPYFACDIDLPYILQGKNELLIIGHSLGKTDHFYFKSFFRDQARNKIKKPIEITHHGEDGWYDIMMQIDDLTNQKLALFRQNNNVIFIDTQNSNK